MDRHKEECSRVVTYMPEEEKCIMEFRNYNKQMDVPFVIYADFECTLEQVINDTTKVNKHKPCAYSYYIKCKYNNSLSIFKLYTGEDAAEHFVKSLDVDCREIYYKYLSLNTPMTPLTPIEEFLFQTTVNCSICEKELGDDRVRDHCHITGKYRGATHSQCNLNYTVPNFIPIFFHNFSSYDCHLFIKELLKTIPGTTHIIPQNKELYISLSHTVNVGFGNTLEYRFLDSLRFMASSLDTLAKNLSDDNFCSVREHFPNDIEFNLMKRKGVFCYEYLSTFDKLNERKLPDINNFYSSLNDKHCSQEDYEHAKNVWDTFNCQNLRDYMELYLKADVLILTDVFENFRNVCKSVHKLDPSQFYTAPGLSFDAMLKHTNVSLELLRDVDMYNFIKNGIRGGLTQCCRRYTKANNKFMKDYDKKLPSSFLAYLDANNLYGWAMRQHLPKGNFQWVEPYQMITDPESIKNFRPDSQTGYIYEVDLEYPVDYHDDHNDLPFCASNKRMGGSKYKKLVADFEPKRFYAIHYLVLKQCLDNGLILQKVHRVLSFDQEPWLASYIDKNTAERTKAKNAFEKNFFKLLNNAVYGKTMENIEKRKDVKLVTHWERTNRNKLGAQELISKPNFHSIAQFSDEFWAVQMNQSKIICNKPIYLGFCILELSKWKMYDFHYEYMKKKFGNRVQLNYMDTDSFIYTIFTENFYKEISPDIDEYFDTSDYPPNNIHKIPLKNKKVIGMMKDENCGKIMTEFVGLGPKMYSFTVEDGTEIKKAKGVKKSVIEKYSIDRYKECLFNEIITCDSMLSFRSKLHEIYTNRLSKIVLNYVDTKRKIKSDKINTFAWGHSAIELDNLNNIDIDFVPDMDINLNLSYDENVDDLLPYL